MKLFAQIQIPLFSQISFLETLLFTKHLSIMLKSGITVLEALDILEKQTKSDAFRKILIAISSDIKNGQSLTIALGKHPKVFNSLYVSLIEVGEQSGKLDENLAFLALQLSKEHAFSQKIKGALAYPVIVLIAALIVGLGVGIFVLPKLISLFNGLDVQLPLSTQILLEVATVMQNYGIVIIIGVIILVILFRLLITTPKTKPFFDRVLLSIPLFGGIAQNSQLAILCRSLGIMILSGLPITQALEIESKVTTNCVYQGYIENLLVSVTKGQSLSNELNKSKYKMIPLIAAKMIAVGEETGKLDETLLYLADFFEEAVDDATKNITTTLEPIMLLVIGLFVAFIAFSIITPIYSLTGSIQK